MLKSSKPTTNARACARPSTANTRIYVYTYNNTDMPCKYTEGCPLGT